MSLVDYERIVRRVPQLTPQRVETSIFSITGRGYYENPLTDLLAFFINPHEVHGFGDLFLKSLFESAGVVPPSMRLVSPPNREQFTDRGGRVDLIVEGDEWVLLVENKVRHRPLNPFSEYQRYARSYGGGRTAHCFLLSVRNEKPPIGWRVVTWRAYVEQIKRNVGAYMMIARDLKWHVLMREFLLNVESECGDEIMSDARFEFIRSNYESVLEMRSMLGEYISRMASRGLAAVTMASAHSDAKTWHKQHTWTDDNIALRLFSSAWGPQTNIVLILKRSGALSISFYVYDVDELRVGELRALIDTAKYREWTESTPITRCFGASDERDHEAAFREITEVATRLNAFLAP